jgi:hypothetical protein
VIRFRASSQVRRRRFLSSTLVVVAALVACERAPEPGAEPPVGHVLTDSPSGIAVDLPRIWKDRYRVSDSASAGEPGVERRLALRFVRADSGLVAEPMLVIRVISATAWNEMGPDSAARRYGLVVARDASRLVAMQPASANPLAAGTADAVAFDSLMMVVLQRPMRVSLRR